MTTGKDRLDEYLRRNLLVASAVGARASVRAAIVRAGTLKRQPKWLAEKLAAIDERLRWLPRELAQHRDEYKDAADALAERLRRSGGGGDQDDKGPSGGGR